MENVIAVEVELSGGGHCYFVTWGRIQSAVDPSPVCKVVMKFAQQCSLGAEPVRARLCQSLREAAGSAEAPYLFEALTKYSTYSIPFGDGYKAWQKERAEVMDQGKEIYYCGRPG